MRYVIVGGSIAGISAAKAIRQSRPGADVSLVSDEGRVPYYRPMIPMLVSGEKAGPELAWPEDLEKSAGTKLVQGRAVRLDPGRRSLLLDGGRELAYDRLLLATGARARGLDAPGVGLEGVFTFRTMQDALGIRQRALTGGKAVVAGGGFAGIKAAESLAKCGLGVTVVEMLPEILLPRLDRHAAGIITSALRSKGVAIRTSDTVTEVQGDRAGVRAVVTASGEKIQADIVVVAIGTVPNTELLEGTGADMDGGAAVGDSLETGISGVFAAGDVARHSEIPTGRKALCALWSNAAEMGRIAGMNMAGSSLKYPGFLSVKNAAEIAGVPVISVGDVTGEGYEEAVARDGLSYRKLFFRGDVLTGAIFTGELRGAGLYQNLIRNQVPLKGRKAKAVEGRLTYADFASGQPAWR